MPTSRHSSDSATNLTHLLPTGTFITFQTLAPIFTNNGECGSIEKIMTGALLFLFIVICFCLNFTDSITTESGKVYYGLVTPSGLYNPNFQKSNIPGDLFQGDCYFTGGSGQDEYKLQFTDFVNGFLAVLIFGVLSCLTPPITTCYYKNISNTVVKSTPILAAIVVGIVFTVFPSVRHGLGFALTTSGFGLVPDNRNTESAQPSEAVSGASPNAERVTDAAAAIGKSARTTTQAAGGVATNV